MIFAGFTIDTVDPLQLNEKGSGVKTVKNSMAYFVVVFIVNIHFSLLVVLDCTPQVTT
jgi:hypothetical protein